jgi:hypothetical protein
VTSLLPLIHNLKWCLSLKAHGETKLKRRIFPCRAAFTNSDRIGGRLVAPIGESPATQELVVLEKTTGGQIRRRAVRQ